MNGFRVILFLTLFLGFRKRLMVKNTWVKEEVKNWHVYKRLKQHYGISFNSKMAWHCHRLKRPRAWILRVMTILTLVCTRCTLNFVLYLVHFYFILILIEPNKTVVNKKQTPDKGPVMLLYELFNDVQIDCVSSDGVQHSRFKMVATVNNQKFEGTGALRFILQNFSLEKSK